MCRLTWYEHVCSLTMHLVARLIRVTAPRGQKAAGNDANMGRQWVSACVCLCEGVCVCLCVRVRACVRWRVLGNNNYRHLQKFESSNFRWYAIHNIPLFSYRSLGELQMWFFFLSYETKSHVSKLSYDGYCLVQVNARPNSSRFFRLLRVTAVLDKLLIYQGSFAKRIWQLLAGKW